MKNDHKPITVIICIKLLNMQYTPMLNIRYSCIKVDSFWADQLLYTFLTSLNLFPLLQITACRSIFFILICQQSLTNWIIIYFCQLYYHLFFLPISYPFSNLMSNRHHYENCKGFKWFKFAAISVVPLGLILGHIVRYVQYYNYLLYSCTYFTKQLLYS